MRANKQTQPIPAKQAFEYIPKIYPIKSSARISHKVKLNGVALPKNHSPRFHSERDINIFRKLALDIQSGQNKYTSSKALIELYKAETVYKTFENFEKETYFETGLFINTPISITEYAVHQ